MKHSNIEKLGSLMQAQMKKTAQGNRTICLELGTINKDLALIVSSLSNPIPRGDYMLCRQLTLGPTHEILTQTKAGQGTHPHGPSGGHSQYEGSGVHSHPSSEGAHVHDVLIPETMRWIKPGDRVLVAWVGTEAVVIDLVYDSKGYGG